MPPTFPGADPSFTLLHFAQDSSDRLHLHTRAAGHREEFTAGAAPAPSSPGLAWLLSELLRRSRSLPLLPPPAPPRLRRAGEEPAGLEVLLLLGLPLLLQPPLLL